MSETDLVKLYSGRILQLASDIPRNERLDSADASVRRRSPLCGSTITVDVVMRDGIVVDYGQDVKACALGQAAASIVGATVVGLNLVEVETARDQLLAMLKAEGPPPAAPFDGLEVLLPARDFKNRHASIMLALDATCESIRTAQNSDCA